MKTARTVLIAAIAATAFFAAHAQDNAVTVQVHGGNVMTSQGGEFVTAASGSQVAPGSRIMLAEGASASLVYASGCTQAIAAAGVHAVPAMCQATPAQAPSAIGAGTAAGVDWASAGLLFAGTAVVAAGLSQMGDGDPLPPPPPVSR